MNLFQEANEEKSANPKADNQRRFSANFDLVENLSSSHPKFGYEVSISFKEVSGNFLDESFFADWCINRFLLSINRNRKCLRTVTMGVEVSVMTGVMVMMAMTPDVVVAMVSVAMVMPR